MTDDIEWTPASHRRDSINSELGSDCIRGGGTNLSDVSKITSTSKAQISHSGAASAVGPYAIAVSGSLTTYHESLPLTPYQVRTSMPRDTDKFTGRAKHIATILSRSRNASGLSVVQTINGMPGVGKSTLAIRVAHQVKDIYPDRQLLIDLRGYTPGTEPTGPFDALGELLMALGMDSRYLPKTLAQRVAHWRSLMANERAVIVIDNALDSKQVTPLLPGGANTFTIVTSRRYLGDLDCDATSITLNPLTDTEALELFRRLAPRALSESDDQVHEVAVTLAGNLPLAISILARLYVNRPTWCLRYLATRLRNNVLKAKVENTTIAAAFDISYESLTSSHKSFFTLLGLHPGTEIDEFAAAALAGISCSEATELLDELFNLRLITEPSSGHPGRYRMHDLVRSYARSVARGLPQPLAASALSRLHEHYSTQAELADSILTRYTRPARSAVAVTASDSGIFDTKSALAWCRAERSNLLACLDQATMANQSERVIRLTAGLAALFRYDGPWDEAARRHQVAIDAARDLNSDICQADALLDLANILRLDGRYVESVRSLDAALLLYRGMGNRLGEANVLTEIGAVRWMEGALSSAAEVLTQGVHIFSDIGDTRGTAFAYNNLGVVWQLSGKYERACEALEYAISLFDSIGEELGKAHSLNNLGVVLRLKSEGLQSIMLLNRALDAYRKIGNVLGQGNTLKELGITYRISGNCETAILLLSSALELQRRAGNRLGEANALKNLGVSHHLSGRNEAASCDLELALEIYGQIGDRVGKADSMKFLGSVRTAQGNYREAGHLLTEALFMFREIGDRPGETEVLNFLGSLYRAYRDAKASLEYHQKALASAREIGSRTDEANSFLGIARCFVLVDDLAAARREFEAALMLLREIGSVHYDEVAAELASLPAEGSCDPEL